MKVSSAYFFCGEVMPHFYNRWQNAQCQYIRNFNLYMLFFALIAFVLAVVILPIGFYIEDRKEIKLLKVQLCNFLEKSDFLDCMTKSNLGWINSIVEQVGKQTSFNILEIGFVKNNGEIIETVYGEQTVKITFKYIFSKKQNIVLKKKKTVEFYFSSIYNNIYFVCESKRQNFWESTFR